MAQLPRRDRPFRAEHDRSPRARRAGVPAGRRGDLRPGCGRARMARRTDTGATRTCSKPGTSDALAELLLSTIRDADQAVIRDPDYLRLFGVEGRAPLTAGESLATSGPALSVRTARSAEPSVRPAVETILERGPALAAHPGGRRARPVSRARHGRLSRDWPTAWRQAGCLSALSDFVLLTCEHGGNRVPAEFARLFRGKRNLLDSHRGYDPGALELARTCARRLKVPLHFATSRGCWSNSTAPPTIRGNSRSPRNLFPPPSGKRSSRNTMLHIASAIEAELATRRRSGPAGDSPLAPHVYARTRRRRSPGRHRPSVRPESPGRGGVWQSSERSRSPAAARISRSARTIPTSARRTGLPPRFANVERDRLSRHRTRSESKVALGDRPPWRRLQQDIAEAIADTISG